MTKRLKITHEMAEFLGAHVGDGTLYRTNTSIVWELRGALYEKEYYTEHICPLIKSLFNLDVKSKFRSGGKSGAWGVQISKKPVINSLISYGFKPGTKTYSVSVPNYIFNSCAGVKKAFIRGLFDTDGCLRFDKKNKNGQYTYPRIELGFASVNLRNSLKRLLDTLGFESFTWKSGPKCFSLCLAGKQKVYKWFKEIQPKNPKHLKKYLTWSIKGFYP